MKSKKNVQNKYYNTEREKDVRPEIKRGMEARNSEGEEAEKAESRKSAKNRHSKQNKENDTFSFNRKVFVFVLCKYYVERIKPNFSCCCYCFSCCAKYFEHLFFCQHFKDEKSIQNKAVSE